MATARGSRRRPSKGWAPLETPVPGDVMACVEELGLEVRRVTGDEIEMKCPEHLNRTGKEDRHPSFSINGEEGYFNCFSCGYRGPFVVLVKDALGCSSEDAVAWVKARGGIERVRKVLDRHKSAGLQVVENDTTKQYNEASLALFVTPPPVVAKTRNLSVASCNHYGVLWDTERDMWIVPIRDPETGKLWGWQEKNSRWFRNRPTDVKKSQTLFGLDVFEGRTAILVESPLDVVRLHTAGVVGGLSSFGVATSDEQMDLIIDVADTLIVALDNDKDGQKYNEILRKSYSRRGITMRFINYGDMDVKDIGEMTDQQIHTALDTSISSVLARFK